MLYTLSYYFIATLLVIIFAYILGYVIFRFFIKNDSVDIFKNLFTGIIVSVTIYSIILTNIKTINIFIVFLGLIWYYIYKKKYSKDLRSTSIKFTFNWNDLLYLCGLTLVLYIINVLTLINIKSFSFSGYFWDTYFYSRVSQYLNSGIENTYLELNYINNNHEISFYHYFELWFAALISKVFDIPTYPSYILISYTVLQVSIFYGFLNLLKNKYKKLFVNMIFAFLMLYQFFIFKVLIDYLYNITHLEFLNSFYKADGVGFSMTQWVLPKGLIVIMPIIFIFNEIKKQNHLNVVFLTLLLTIINPVIGISLSIGYALLLLLELKFKAIPYLLIYVLFGLFYAFFLVFGIDNHILGEESSKFVLNIPYSLIQIKLFAKVLFSIFVSLSLFVFFIGYKRSIAYLLSIKRFIVVALIGSFVGLIVNILIVDYDSKQFWTYTLIPTFTMILIYLLIETWINSKLNIKILLITLMTITVFIGISEKLKYKNVILTKYGSIYEKKVLNYLSKKNVVMAGSIFSDSYYGNIHTTKSTYRTLGEFIHFYRNGYINFTLTDYKASKVLSKLGYYELSALRNYKKTAYFNNYLKNNENKTIGESQLEFINTYKIQYVFVQAGGYIEPELRLGISCIARDELSGEQFFVVNNLKK